MDGISTTTEIAGDDDFKARRNSAINFHNTAMQVVAHDKQHAYRLLCSSVTIDPSLAQGWYALGNATADLQMIPASVACFRRALSLPDGTQSGDMNPNLRAMCLINLSHRLTNMGENDEAERVNIQAIEYLLEHPDLDPEGAPFAWTNMSQILSVQGRNEEALAYAQEAWKRSQAPIIELGLAFAYLFAGDFENGLRHFESRFPYRLPVYQSYPYEKWSGVLDHNKTLYVVSEQGAGDTLSFMRFLGRAAARCKKVVFQVHDHMLRLVADSIQHWGNIECIPLSPQFPVADAWCSIMSLPTALGLTTQQIIDQHQGWSPQYELRPDPEWKHKGDVLHVGICWGGSKENGIDRWRSIPFEFFLELARVPNVRLYSLQVGDRAVDMHQAGAAALVRDMQPWIKDVSDTCSIIAELDLVISIESFLPHLMGAMNRECWVLCSRLGGDWRLGRQGDTQLWYPKARLFRQGVDGEWAPVFGRVVEALRERAAC